MLLDMDPWMLLDTVKYGIISVVIHLVPIMHSFYFLLIFGIAPLFLKHCGIGHLKN